MKNPNIPPEIKNQIFTFYRNVKYLREKSGLTTKQLSEIIGISEKKLSAAENCESVGCFYDKHVKNVCVYFNVSADVLFYEELSS